MIIEQLTANTIASASLFRVCSTRVLGFLPLQIFCTITSMARTNAARVKSTVLFLGCDECQYVIPAKALPKDARNVEVSLDILPPPIRLTIGSRALRPLRMMTTIRNEAEREYRRPWQIHRTVHLP